MFQRSNLEGVALPLYSHHPDVARQYEGAALGAAPITRADPRSPVPKGCVAVLPSISQLPNPARREHFGSFPCAAERSAGYRFAERSKAHAFKGGSSVLGPGSCGSLTGSLVLALALTLHRAPRVDVRLRRGALYLLPWPRLNLHCSAPNLIPGALISFYSFHRPLLRPWSDLAHFSVKLTTVRLVFPRTRRPRRRGISIANSDRLLRHHTPIDLGPRQ